MAIQDVGNGKYRIFVDCGKDYTGKRIRRSKVVYSTLKGKALDRFLNAEELNFSAAIEKEMRLPDESHLASGTFAAYVEFWTKHKDGTTPRTMAEYQKLLKNRLLPLLGATRLDSITKLTIQQVMTKIKESPSMNGKGQPLSPKSVKHHHTLLNVLFNDAVRWEILEENPASRIHVPTPKVQLKDNFYTPQEFIQFLSCLSKASVKHRLAVLLSASTGIRLGEMLALTRSSFDLERCEIDVSSSITLIEGKCSIKNTKNEEANICAFPPYLLPLLKEHFENEDLKRETCTDIWMGAKNKEKDFVFSQQNGAVNFPTTFPNWLKKFQERNNLRRITWHGLRHTYVTLLLQKKISISDISAAIGHSDARVTLGYYAHAVKDANKTISGTFDDLMKNAIK